MTSETKPKRLSAVVAIYNVATTTIVEYLASKGIEIENNPNAKVQPEWLALLDEKFKDSKVMNETAIKDTEKAKENKEVADFWKTRKRLGCFFSHVGGMKFYLKLCAKIANKKRHTGWIGVPSTGDPVENYPEELFAELTNVEFCGYEFPTMARYEECLAIQFGPNYMQIPDPSRRECHTAYKMDFCRFVLKSVL